MEPYTLNRQFEKQDIIDGFSSCIWTERYYGDSEVELVVPNTPEMIDKLPIGVFLGLNDADEVMILENRNFEEGKIKLTGISLLKWFDNRFVRVSAKHEDRYWNPMPAPAGKILWDMVDNMCIAGSPYLSGVIDIGIENPERLAIPNLLLRAYDNSGPDITVGIPYGPLYSAMHEIATTYEVGITLKLERLAEDAPFYLGFYSYRGLVRTSDQTDYPPVRFSPQMDSFTDIKELESIAALKTLVYAFAPGLTGADAALVTEPGVSELSGAEHVGFDLRAMMVFADDITTDTISGDPTVLVRILNSRAQDAITNNRYIVAVDGEIVPESQFKYGVHYNLGDIIEVQGNSGATEPARITEYIRAQDEGGERAYPTVAMIG
jgi:Siphovirus ReqiPepy6 Gp37-like protein